MNTRPFPLHTLWFVSVVVLVWVAQPIRAQNDRRDRQDPELVVESGGRQGACDQLLFTRDGRHLLAAGDDKVVRVWPCVHGTLDGSAMKALRWSSWRDQRGVIYAMAVSPDHAGRRVAIGGLGVRVSTVALLDRTSGAVLNTVYPAKPGENYYAVMALAFDRRGERVAYGTADGTVWLWDFRTNRKVGKHTGQAEFNRIRLVHFLDDDRLLSVAESGEVVSWDLAPHPAEGTRLSWIEKDDGSLFRAVLSPDGQWLAAAVQKKSLVAVRTLDGASRNDIHLEEHEFARSLAFAPRRGRLAVGVGRVDGESRFGVESDDRIRLYDLAASPPTPAEGPRNFWRADCLAFHPESGQIAIAGGDNHEVTLWDLKNLQKPTSLIRGTGSGLWDVGLSRDGQLLGFREGRDGAARDPNRRAQGPWRVFNLPGRDWPDPREFEPVPQLRQVTGWHVAPDPRDPYLWYAVDAEGNQHALPLDRDRDGPPRCWTFVPVKEGAPPLLAVGHYWGLSIFELTEQGARRTCLCAGHQGEVMALSVAADGSWLVSASTDQTIAAFTLEGAGRPDLGARFVLRDARLFVDAITTGSAAWEAGLVRGDEIELFALAAHEVPGGPEAWLEQLRRPQPGKEHYFRILRDGKRLELVTTGRRRPLWRFFPTREGEWILWMWRNSYYDTSTKGDFYVGWHVNSPDLTKTPSYYRAEQFRKQLERPDVLDKLLQSRSTAAALRLVSDNPVPLRFDLAEPPEVAVKLGPVQPGKPVDVMLQVTPHGDNPDHQPRRAELWLNDFRLAVWDDLAQWEKRGRSYVLSLKLTEDRLRTGRNVVTFQTYNRLGGRADQAAVVDVDRPARPPRLLGLAVGINDYSAARPAPGGRRLFGNLQSARPDAEAMSKAWSAQEYYDGVDMLLHLDDKAARKDVLAALDELARRARPDDRCVVFLAGHGVFLKRGPRATFLFCFPHYDPASPNETGLTSEELYEKLAAIPCRKLVLLDACHSGEAANPVRQLTPGGQGPIVMAACDRNQSSYENKEFGHGLFSYAVLEALGPRFKAAASDPTHKGQLHAADLFRYTRTRLPELLRQIPLPDYQQVPILYVPPGADDVPFAVRK